MARPPLPLGTWGTITTEKIRDGSYRALTRFRDTDGNTRRVTAAGPSKAAAERALRDVLGTRTAPAGEHHSRHPADRPRQPVDHWSRGRRADRADHHQRVPPGAGQPGVTQCGRAQAPRGHHGSAGRAPAEVARSEREPAT